jgi:hypothetical protein
MEPFRSLLTLRCRKSKAVPAFAALPVNFHAAQALTKHGATCAFNHLTITLFVSYLHHAVRNDILKTRPTSVKDTFDKAKELERIKHDPKSSTVDPVMEVTISPTSDIPAEEHPN